MCGVTADYVTEMAAAGVARHILEEVSEEVVEFKSMQLDEEWLEICGEKVSSKLLKQT